jgi:hypothetical protein
MMKKIKYYAQSFYYPTLWYGKLRGLAQPYLSTHWDAHSISGFEKCHHLNDRIIIGDIASAYNKEKLKEMGVTHIICAILGVDPAFPEDFEYQTFPLRDIPEEKIDQCFVECNRYMNNVLGSNPENKIFIHCVYGVSRSGTLLSSFVMEKEELSAEGSVELVKRCREVVQPNEGFMVQLKSFEESLAELRNAPLE